MTTTLIQEFVCSATGGECKATEAWYALDSAAHLPTLRASAFWAEAGDAQQEIIAAALGISEPFPAVTLWKEFPKAIRADFEQALELAMARLAVD